LYVAKEGDMVEMSVVLYRAGCGCRKEILVEGDGRRRRRRRIGTRGY
jgi:hypothetical protein